MTLGIDAGHWSRIMKGDANFPQDKLCELMDICGNEAPLIWLCDVRGYELKKKESEMEKELREIKEQLEKERYERNIEKKAFKEMLGG